MNHFHFVTLFYSLCHYQTKPNVCQEKKLENEHVESFFLRSFLTQYIGLWQQKNTIYQE